MEGELQRTPYTKEEMMLQKAKAASRKATGNHNWADRAGNGDTHTERWLTWGRALEIKRPWRQMKPGIS